MKIFHFKQSHKICDFQAQIAVRGVAHNSLLLVPRSCVVILLYCRFSCESLIINSTETFFTGCYTGGGRYLRFQCIVSFLYQYIAAYRENYSSSHVLIRLIENRKNALDEKFVGTVLMDLSEAFDCIPHDLLIATIHACGFSEKTDTFFISI